VFTARYELNPYKNSDYLGIKLFSDSQIILRVTLNLEQVKYIFFTFISKQKALYNCFLGANVLARSSVI